MDEYQLIQKLTDENLSENEKTRVFKDFSHLLGWEPSEFIKPSKEMEKFSNGHIVVEHGLLNSAVITFLKIPFLNLSNEIQKNLLEISYNNLIDWHIYVEHDKVSFIFNRLDNPKPITKRISKAEYNSLKGSMFTQITDLSKNPNFPALDEVLINDISKWKMTLASEMPDKLNLSIFSALFNGIFFVRAAEDLKIRETNNYTQLMLDEWEKLNKTNEVSIKRIINNCLHKLITGSSENFVDLESLESFVSIDSGIIYNLLLSFYKNSGLPYRYDFAIMSKHALSRIYEKYVSVLRFDIDEKQLSLIPMLPTEEYSKTYGSVYTPQFIARFFARFLVERTPPALLRKMSIIDPACGSGIFLRTILEFLLTPAFDPYSSFDYQKLFQNIEGIDNDPNAVEASKLSIALLYLVIMGGELPHSLNLHTENSLDYFLINKLKNYYDVYICNPPYIAFDRLSDSLKTSVLEYLDELSIKKPDAYLAFVKLGVDILKSNGLGFFVLPYSFLKTDSAMKVREYMLEKVNILGLIDLSSIPVFKDKGSYVILLIVQKKNVDQLIQSLHKTTIVIIQDLVGHALQDYLNDIEKETSFYSLFKINQNDFNNQDWSKALISPSAYSIVKKLQHFKPLSELFEIRLGVITGGDSVFIVDRIPSNDEKEIWKPLLKDREMKRYYTPKKHSSYVFYPIIDGKKLNETEIKEEFPLTWEYLSTNRKKLSRRKLTEDKFWWFPLNLRKPEELFNPKIITPHLVLIPKFSIDTKGKFAISHSPFIFHKYDSSEEILYFLTAILNSNIGAWLISTHSDKYSRGYARLEVKTLNSIPIPDPSQIDTQLFHQIVNLVKNKISSPNADIDESINDIVSILYGLNNQEKFYMGFEGFNA